jgi:hypothetical protein
MLKASDIDRIAKNVEDITTQLNNLGRSHVNKALRHRVTVESHDDGDGYDGLDGDPADGDEGYEDVSNPSMEASDEERPGYADDELDDEDDEDDEDEFDKRSINEVLRENDAANRPGARKTSDHSTWRTKAQAMVDHISHEEGCSKTEALQRLRSRYPDIANGNPINKSAPPSFEDLVNVEMRKGVNREIAAQRVVQLHGFNAFAGGVSKRLVKGANAEFEFQKRVGQVMDADDVDASEATRRVRREDPSLYRALQRSTR